MQFGAALGCGKQLGVVTELTGIVPPGRAMRR